VWRCILCAPGNGVCKCPRQGCVQVPVAMLCAGGVGWTSGDYVEYDLECDDEEWLAAFDAGQGRLDGLKLEKMLWKLDVACAEANERAFNSGPWLGLRALGSCWAAHSRLIT
jgi:hypothetical protein